jgi:hypothetical protein
MFWLVLMLLTQDPDPNCTSRRPGLAAPECTSYGTGVDMGKPFVTCRAACYTKDKPKRPDGGINPLDTHVVHAEVPGTDSQETRAACRAKLQRQADNGCKP